jgi:hypothetical protein
MHQEINMILITREHHVFLSKVYQANDRQVGYGRSRLGEVARSQRIKLFDTSLQENNGVSSYQALNNCDEVKVRLQDQEEVGKKVQIQSKTGGTVIWLGGQPMNQ